MSHPVLRGPVLPSCLLAVLFTLAQGRVHASSDASIPIELTNDQLLVTLDVADARDLLFILDTGVTPSVIDRETALAAGLELGNPLGQAGGTGNGEGAQLHECRLRHVRLGGVQIGEIKGVASNLSWLKLSDGRAIHGILGESFFEGRIVEIDYPARRLRVHGDGDAVRAQRRGEHSPIVEAPLRSRKGDTLPMIDDAAINGHPVKFAIDTGSNLTVLLHASTLEALDLDPGEGAEVQMVRGARGQAEIVDVHLASLRLGPFEIEDIQVSGARSGFRPVDMDRAAGNVGSGLLKDFVVLIDDPGQTLMIWRP